MINFNNYPMRLRNKFQYIKRILLLIISNAFECKNEGESKEIEKSTLTSTLTPCFD